MRRVCSVYKTGAPLHPPPRLADGYVCCATDCCSGSTCGSCGSTPCPGSNSLSGGAIAGIVIGVIGLIIVVVSVVLQCKRRAAAEAAARAGTVPVAATGTTTTVVMAGAPGATYTGAPGVTYAGAPGAAPVTMIPPGYVMTSTGVMVPAGGVYAGGGAPGTMPYAGAGGYTGYPAGPPGPNYNAPTMVAPPRPYVYGKTL